MTSNPRSTEQKRAEKALNVVKNVTKSNREDYRTLAMQAPAHIQTNGLGQTLAFWRSKGRTKPADILYSHVSEWVCPRMNWSETDDLLTKLTACSIQKYRRATAETMAFLIWLKRFAEAELKEAETEQENG